MERKVLPKKHGNDVGVGGHRHRESVFKKAAEAVTESPYEYWLNKARMNCWRYSRLRWLRGMHATTSLYRLLDYTGCPKVW